MKFLIVGLGNVGVAYANNRHNVGFMVLDKLAAKEDCTFADARYAAVASVKKKGRQFILIKPSTYMNLSGKAVNYWMQTESIPIENILIIVDDIALPTATLRLKAKGSDGGHNGLINIIETLQSVDFARLRIGIGNNFAKGRQAEYVLSDFTKEELQLINNKMDKIHEIIYSFGLQGIDRTMNIYNTNEKNNVDNQ